MKKRKKIRFYLKRCISIASKQKCHEFDDTLLKKCHEFDDVLKNFIPSQKTRSLSYPKP